MQGNIVPFIESDAAASSNELRGRMEEHGYLFFRGVVPREVVLEVRRAVLELCNEAGWLDQNQPLSEGITTTEQQPLKEGMPEYMAVYRQVLRLPEFHVFPESPSLRAVAQKLLGEPPLVHPRRIGRITFPNYLEAATPAHQDHHYIRGAVETYSCWTPLGECPMELGGLAIEPGSHRRGFIEHTVKSPGVGGAGVPVQEEETVWHSADFNAGDALFFHSYTIHKALPNLTPNRLRISTDNRYQRAQEDIAAGSLKPHFGQ